MGERKRERKKERDIHYAVVVTLFRAFIKSEFINTIIEERKKKEIEMNYLPLVC